MFGEATTYEEACRNFRWNIPSTYNIAASVCDDQAAQMDALLIVDADLNVSRYTYGQLSRLSSKFANLLMERGHRPGERMLVGLKASLEAAVAYLGILKAGLVAVPIFSTLNAKSVAERAELSGATGIVTVAGAGSLSDLAWQAPGLRQTYLVGGQEDAIDHKLLFGLLEPAADRFRVASTHPNDPALLAFTSGSEATPKGVLHGHRMLIGTLPALQMAQDRPRRGEVTWAPADWGWLMGLNGALASWRFGMTVLVYTGPAFNPDLAFEILSRNHVVHAALPVTALRMMQVFRDTKATPALRSISTSGEAVGQETFAWVRSRFGLNLHELYAMTECASIAANGSLSAARFGSMGRALPGHDVQIVDEVGNILSRGEEGLISLGMPDPAVFLGYWNDPEATNARFVQGRFVTSDLACQDDEGYLWYRGRSDDVIKSAGYRISPSVIEEAARKHPAIDRVAAVGVADAVCGQVVRLWIQLKSGEYPSTQLKQSIQRLLRSQLGVHEWPREILFDPALPVTDTGKVLRRELRTRSLQTPY